MRRLRKFSTDFCKCGVAGWCLEVLATSAESILARDWRLIGQTSLLMFPIYGCGAVLPRIAQWTDAWIGEGFVRPGDRLIRHGMLYMVLIFVGEYLSGAWLRSLGVCPWDYSGVRASVGGLIRLDFAPLWFATGLLFEKIVQTVPKMHVKK
ncbi:MAG: putative ABC transporter permease [Clostridiales bacterium]|nr:putative ABC transporter permease [Clostridiales bacterium]